MLSNVLLVGIGGFAGAVSRYVVGALAQNSFGASGFPVGTLTVNVIGCFVIGLLSQLAESHQLFTPQTRALVFVGFLGAFTTFSTFGNDTVSLVQSTKHAPALLYVMLHIVLGFGAVWVGQVVAGLAR